MKLTLDLPETLLEKATALAARDEITLTELVEYGLRQAVEQRSSRHLFHLPDASWGQGGLLASYDWSSIRQMIYADSAA
ncbi:MAG: hypothetical protein U0R19_38475 [Bryobacteraceae bacterium]